MSKVLTAEDLVIGNKYVPVSKSVGIKFHEWIRDVSYKQGDPVIYHSLDYEGDHRFCYGSGKWDWGMFLPSDVVEYVEPDEEAVTDMTVQEFYSGFNLSFLTEEERQTIYTATELFAKGKVRVALTSAPPSASGKDWADVEETIKLSIGLDPYRASKIVGYLKTKYAISKL